MMGTHWEEDGDEETRVGDGGLGGIGDAPGVRCSARRRSSSRS